MERYDRMRDIAQKLGDEAEEKARVAVAQSELAAENTAYRFVMIGVLAILLAMAMALLIGWIIAAPLKMISDIAGKVASGDLTVSIPAGHRTDEVGELLRAFGAMLDGLRKLMREINEGVVCSPHLPAKSWPPRHKLHRAQRRPRRR